MMEQIWTKRNNYHVFSFFLYINECALASYIVVIMQIAKHYGAIYLYIYAVFEHLMQTFE